MFLGGLFLLLSLIVFNFPPLEKKKENRWGKRIARRKMAPEGQKKDGPDLLSPSRLAPPTSL